MKPDKHGTTMATSPGQRVALVAVFTAAAAVLGLLKLPSPVGSVALDSLPGYLLAGWQGVGIGALVGVLGHLASAASAGFPLGLVHLAVAAQMALWCTAFGVIQSRIRGIGGSLAAVMVAVALNGVVGPLMLSWVGLVPRAVAVGIIPFLAVASAVNTVLAAAAIQVLRRRDEQRRAKQN